KRLHPDILIVTALLSGSAWSLYQAYRGVNDFYVDSLAMVLFLLLLGRHVAFTFRDRLQANHPWKVRLSRGEVPIEALKEGDIMTLRSGEEVPCDSVLESEDSLFDESVLTGEITPVQR